MTATKKAEKMLQKLHQRADARERRCGERAAAQRCGRARLSSSVARRLTSPFYADCVTVVRQTPSCCKPAVFSQLRCRSRTCPQHRFLRRASLIRSCYYARSLSALRLSSLPSGFPLCHSTFDPRRPTYDLRHLTYDLRRVAFHPWRRFLFSLAQVLLFCGAGLICERRRSDFV